MFKNSAKSLLKELEDMDRNITNNHSELMTGYDRDIRQLTEAAYSVLESNQKLAQEEIANIPPDVSEEEKIILSNLIVERYKEKKHRCYSPNEIWRWWLFLD